MVGNGLEVLLFPSEASLFSFEVFAVQSEFSNELGGDSFFVEGPSGRFSSLTWSDRGCCEVLIYELSIGMLIFFWIY